MTPVSLLAAARALGFGDGRGSRAVACRRALERLERWHGVSLLTRVGGRWEVDVERAADLMRARPTRGASPVTEPAGVLTDALATMLRDQRDRLDDLEATVAEMREELASLRRPWLRR